MAGPRGAERRGRRSWESARPGSLWTWPAASGSACHGRTVNPRPCPPARERCGCKGTGTSRRCYRPPATTACPMRPWPWVRPPTSRSVRSIWTTPTRWPPSADRIRAAAVPLAIIDTVGMTTSQQSVEAQRGPRVLRSDPGPVPQDRGGFLGLTHLSKNKEALGTADRGEGPGGHQDDPARPGRPARPPPPLGGQDRRGEAPAPWESRWGPPGTNTTSSRPRSLIPCPRNEAPAPRSWKSARPGWPHN